MSRQPKEPTWPFLCILACLFVLSAAAPRAWERTIRSRTAQPSTEDVAIEPETTEAERDDAVARGDSLPSQSIDDHADLSTFPTIALTAPMPTIGPGLEDGNSLLIAVPSPRITHLAIDPGHIDLDLASENALNDPQDHYPSYAADLIATERSDTSDDELARSLPVETPTPEVTDDHDMSAVAGISVLSEKDVADLATRRGKGKDRLSDSAPWTIPVSIYRQLEPLNWDCETGKWARELAEAVDSAATDLASNSANAKESVAQLSILGRDGVAMAKEMEPLGREEMRHILLLLHRRVSVWKSIVKALPNENDPVPPIDWNDVRQSIEQVEDLIEDAQNSSAWAAFLELDTLAEIAARKPEKLSNDERTLACCIYLNLQVDDVTEEQRAFLNSQELIAFKETLRTILLKPIDGAEWVSLLEAFERTYSPKAGERLAVERLKLSISEQTSQVELAEAIQEAYCGPNVRIAVTGYLLNRMLPDREPEYQWVRDTVLGHPVRGRSRTIADVGLALIPDPQKMRAALTIDGLVSASTSSTAGPATFINDSESEYSAIKELELTPQGIHFAPAEVTVDNRTRLRQIRTDFDGIPLFSSLAQSVARSQHDASRPAIRREMNRKVQAQAERQIDEEINHRLGELNDRLKNRLLDPLAAMSLRPEVADAKTTEARMSMQLHLTGVGQLGSNTPRPWAPSDSVLSFQMHQSALNNVIRGLELDGATLTIKELRERLATRFNRPEMLEETNEHDDVLITFADADAARIDFEDGRVAISLGIARLRAVGRQWSNFRVCAYYRAETTQQSASLVRDGVVELIGRMRMGSQITLRSIFSKVFAKGRELPVVPEEMADDPRLKGLDVTQLTFDDGWFGLAVGPERLRPAMANGPSSTTLN